MHFVPPTLMRPAALLAGALLSAGSVTAAESAPRRAQREMSTDRPDATESPFTLEPGRSQLEMSFATYGTDRQSGTRTKSWEAAPFNLRFGLTPSIEGGFFFTPYQRLRVEPRGEPPATTEGMGDFTARGKWNIRGNDGGDFGLGVMLDVVLPTAPRRFGPRKPEAALTVPVAFDLGSGWSGGAMTSLQVARTGDGPRHAVWFNTLTAGHDLTEALGAFYELASTAGDGAHVLTFNTGLTHRLNANLQLDAGVNAGITRTAPDWLWFAGMSRRF